MRKATVEIDKTVGTEFLQSVQIGDKEHTLAGIYADAGLDLTVIHDDSELELPPTGPNFDLPLLHEYMAKHRKQHSEGWYAHVLIVPNIEYAEGWSITQPLGVMYDFRSADLNNMPREGCAISMRAVANNPRVYLRTLAHEVGHIFNLLHPKHELPARPIGTSIMNQTADLMALGGFPDNIEFAFDEGHRHWLSQAPAEYVMPGGRPFADRPGAASDVVQDVPATNTPGLVFEVSTRSGPYQLGEPLYLRLTVRNESATSIDINSVLSVASGTVSVTIDAPGRGTRHFRPAVTTCIEPRPVPLPPGAEILASEPIFFGARGHSFPAPGRYVIRATFQSGSSLGLVAAVAKPYEVEVLEPATAADVDIADVLATPSAALYLILRGGAHLRGAEKALGRIVDEAPDRAVAQHAKLAMATQALTSGSLDASRAVQLLDAVQPDQLDWTHRAEHRRLQAVAGVYGRNDRGKDSAVDAFEILARKSRPDHSRLAFETSHWLDRLRARM